MNYAAFLAFIGLFVLTIACQTNQTTDVPELTPFINRIGKAPLDGGFRLKGYWVWGGCPIKGEDGKFHLFVSRWKKDMPFFIGYVFQSEVVRAVSDTPEGPYKFEEVVLPQRGSEYWDGMMTHNPTIRKLGDQYLLYYIGATYDFEKPDIPITQHDSLNTDEQRNLRNQAYRTIRIGMAVSSSVYGPWERPDEPLLDIRPDKWDNTVITNPAPFIGKNNEIYLIYRSNTPNGLRLGLAKSSGIGEPFVRISENPLFHFDDEHFCEDPFVWWNGTQYEVIMKDLTGNITGEWHAGVHGFSNDGLSWEIADSPKAYSRTVTWENGEFSEQGSFERPQLLFNEKGEPTHIFGAVADGPGGFRNATDTWCMVIPLDGKNE